MPAIARMARSYKWHRAGAGTSCAVGADSSAMLFGGPYRSRTESAPTPGAPCALRMARQPEAACDSRYCVGDSPVSARNCRLKALWSV